MYLQRGLNAHGDSRKGATFETYRALLLGAEWKGMHEVEFKTTAKSKIPGIKHGGEDRAFLPLLTGKDKTDIHPNLSDDKKPRSSDGTIEITDASKLDGKHKPKQGKTYLIDEKAGEGALTDHTIRNYLADLKKYGGAFEAIGGKKYNGVVILADSLGNADKAIKTIAREISRLNPKPPGIENIHVATLTPQGTLLFFKIPGL